LKISGPIIRVRMTSFLMKMNINKKEADSHEISLFFIY
jgi:hypothetical protein